MLEKALFTGWEPAKKRIVVYVDNFTLEFESTEDVVEFVNAYTKCKKEKEEDDNQVL